MMGVNYCNRGITLLMIYSMTAAAFMIFVVITPEKPVAIIYGNVGIIGEKFLD
jgi:hypothetical protein